MYAAGIDAHATYLVVAIVSNDGTLVQKKVGGEGSPAWPWLYELLRDAGHAVLAHPKKLRVIAEANYKNDQIDAVLLARMRLVDLIPQVHAKPRSQREQATLLRHRARLVRRRGTAWPMPDSWWYSESPPWCRSSSPRSRW